jgi:L-erythro-3,5-diaminohexanoate dehydrogenase
LDRVVSPAGVLPQAAQRLDASAEIAPYEVRVRVERPPPSAPRAWPPM